MGMGAGRERNDHAEHGREARHPMLTRLGMWAETLALTSPWTNVYGVARTMLALATAATLITSSTETLFRPALGFPGVPACVGAGRLSFFCLIPRQDLALGQAIAAAILLVVASGWRPRLTGVPHWWISYSFAVSATIPDGGDQVTQILALLLVPVTLTDPRGWHWQSAPQTARPIASLVAWSALFVARLQVAGIYFDSSLAKLATPVWADGTAFYYWSTDPAFGTPWWMRGLIEPVITSSPGVALLTWGPLALEFAIALGLVLDQRARSRLLVLGIGFHAGIAVMIGLVSFAIAMWAALILFLRPMRQEFDVRGLAPLRIFRLWFRESARRAPLPRIVGE